VLPRNRWFIAAALLYALLGGLLGVAWTPQALLHAGLALMVLQAIAGARSLALPGGVLALAGLGVFATRLWPVLRWNAARSAIEVRRRFT